MDGWHHEGKIDWKGKIGWIRCEVERAGRKRKRELCLTFFIFFFGSREMMITISFPLQCPALLLLCSIGSLFEKKKESTTCSTHGFLSWISLCAVVNSSSRRLGDWYHADPSSHTHTHTSVQIHTSHFATSPTSSKTRSRLHQTLELFLIRPGTLFFLGGIQDAFCSP